MKKIKVKIVKNSFEDPCWYANQIGQELNVERDEGDEDYIFWRQSPAHTWIIKKSDCEVVEEDPGVQDGASEGFEAVMFYDGGNSKYVKITREQYKMLKENQKEPEPIPQPEPFDLERAKRGEVFYSKDGFTRFKVVSLSSFNDKLHIVEIVRNGNANVEMINIGNLNPLFYHFAPKEPEYVEGWVVVSPLGFDGIVYKSEQCAGKSVAATNWRVEKIRFPKP